MRKVSRVRFAQAVMIGTQNELGITEKNCEIRFDEETGILYYRLKGTKQVGFSSIGNIAFGLFPEGDMLDIFTTARGKPAAASPEAPASLNQAMRIPNPDRAPLVPAALKPPKEPKPTKAA